MRAEMEKVWNCKKICQQKEAQKLT